MKKRLVCMIMTGVVAASLLGGCGSSTTSTTETVVTDDQASTQAPQTDVEDKKESKDTDSPAQQTSASDFKTKVKDDGTIEIELYRGEASEVVIPDTIDGKEVSVVGGFGNHDEITSVVIPDTVNEISNNAFINCFNIASVKMGANVEKIGSCAFDGCFTTIELPNTLTEIGESAFNGIKLTELNLPDSLKTIGGGAFYRLNIETLTIPGSVEIVGEGSFSGCEQVKEVTIDDVISE